MCKHHHLSVPCQDLKKGGLITSNVVHCANFRQKSVWSLALTEIIGMCVEHRPYLLTYSMEQSPSCEARRFSASQEIPHILRKPKVHYRMYKCPPTVLIQSQIYPAHAPTSHFLKIRLNIILPSTPGFCKWTLSFRFSPTKPCIKQALQFSQVQHCC